MENHTLESEDRTNTKKQNMVGYLEDRLRVTERSSFTCSGLSNMLRVLIMFFVQDVSEDSVVNHWFNGINTEARE